MMCHQTYRLTYLAIMALLFLSIPVRAADNESDNVRLVTTGEILKIDAKKKTFEFRVSLDSFPRGGYRGRRGGSGRMGGRGRFPGGYPGGGRGNPQSSPTLDVKVFTSERTSLRLENNSSDFNRLKVGERVTLTAVHHGKGNDVDAIEVASMQR